MGHVRFPTRDRVFRAIQAAGSSGATREEVIKGAKPLRPRSVEEMMLTLVREGLICENPQDGRLKRWRISCLPAPPTLEEEILRLIREGTNTRSGLLAALGRAETAVTIALANLVRKKQILKIKPGLYGTSEKTLR